MIAIPRFSLLRCSDCSFGVAFQISSVTFNVKKHVVKQPGGMDKKVSSNIFTQTKLNEEPPKHSNEDVGYHSYSNIGRINTSSETSSFLLDEFYTHSPARNIFRENHLFSTPNTLGETSLSAASTSGRTTMRNSDSRGILIDRIKIAQNTIDSLSAKVFCYENEREYLREQKDGYEKGYYKLLQENSQILNDKIAKDVLLKKIDTMGDEVSQLIQAQQLLLQKHNEQQKNIEFYKIQHRVLEEENDGLKKLNDELTEKSAKCSVSVEKLSRSEEDLKNQIIVLKIEKEAQISQLERLNHKMKNQNEKIKLQNEKENSWIRELSSQQDQLKSQREQLVNAEDTIKFLQNEMENIATEKEQYQKNTDEELAAAYKEMATHKESLSLNQKELQLLKGKMKSFEQSSGALLKDICQLKELLKRTENEKEELLNDNFIKDTSISNFQEELKKVERENKSVKQKLKSKEQEIISTENSSKNKQDEMEESLQQSEQRVHILTGEIEKLQNDFNEEKQNFHKEYQLKVLELETMNSKSQEIISTLQNNLKLLTQKFEEINNDYFAYKEDRENQIALKNREICSLRMNETKLSKNFSEIESTNKEYVENSVTLTRRLHRAEAQIADLDINCNEKSILLEKQQITIQELSSNCQVLKTKNKDDLDLIDKLNKRSKSEILSEKALYECQLTSLKADVEKLTVALKSSQQQHRLSSETYKERIKSLQTEHDNQLEDVCNERDEINRELHDAFLDLNEYKSKFTSLQKELEDVSLVNADLKNHLSLLSIELESYQQDVVQNTQNNEKISVLAATVEELQTKILDLQSSNTNCKKDKCTAISEATKAKEELSSYVTRFEQQRKQYENEKKNLLANEANLHNEYKESQIRVQKLKAECRKRAMQCHAKCGELEVLKANNISIQKELDAVTELNKKLQNTVQQSHEDIQLQKTSYEDLLTKELTQQRSEFLMKENQLLKRLSNDNLPVVSFQSPPIPS